jgi:hypothetical protein
MSVSVEYIGHFGNNLFQYIVGRLLAERHHLKLTTPFNHQHIVAMTPPKEGEHFNEPSIEVHGHDWSLENERPKAHYFVRGFFQESDFYWQRRDQILAFAKPVTEVPKRPSGDLAVHFRLGSDYWPGIVIHPSWYQKVLSTTPYDKLFVISDVPDHEVLRRSLEGHKYELIRGNEKDDWDALRGFQRVVCSNSTYCWWAVFFGHASTSFVFKRWLNSVSINLTQFPGSVEVDGNFIHEG